MTDVAIPRFKPGVRLSPRSNGREATLNAPERVLVLDQIAEAIVSRIDGKSDAEAIARELCVYFQAPYDTVIADVKEFLGELAAKGYVTL